MTERKEWIRVSHAPNNNGTVVTITYQEGNLTVKWSAKTYTGQIKAGLKEARKGAERAMTELYEALREEEEAA